MRDPSVTKMSEKEHFSGKSVTFRWKRVIFRGKSVIFQGKSLFFRGKVSLLRQKNKSSGIKYFYTFSEKKLPIRFFQHVI